MAPIEQVVEGLLAGPADPDREFIVSRYTRGDIYAMAAGFREGFSAPEMAGTPVCLCTDDKGIIAAALLASLAGGPKCVLPYAISASVLAETREATGFRLAVSDRDLDIPEGARTILPGRGVWERPGLADTRGLDSIFFQMFTGGSTGRPKVWSKTPLNLFSEAAYLADRYGFGERDIIAATVPPYHIYGLLFSVLVPFLASASVLGPICAFPREIQAALQKDGVTTLVSVPPHYRALNGTEISAPSLRLAFSSAGPLERSDGVYFHGRTGVGVEEIYGSTETGGIASRCPAAGREVLEPFGCIEWKIEDERLCVRSPFVSPDLPVDGGGYYLTGDRVEPAGKGGFSLLGRADGIVKVGGKRVDLNDVREKIMRVPGVRDAYLFSLEGRRGADIAAAIESDMPEAGIRERLSVMLEPYAMPRRVRVVEKIPLTSTGKYDRESIMSLFAINE